MHPDCFQLNPKLVINSLGAAGFVIYVPPDPAPLRFPGSVWLALDAIADREPTQEQLQQHLSEIPEDYQSFEQYLQWLLSKRILLRVEKPAESLSARPTESPRLERKSKIRSVDDSGDTGESNSIPLFTLNPSWPALAQQVLLNLLRLQIWLVVPMLVIVFAYLFFFLLAPAPNALYLLGASAQAPSNIDVLSRMVIALLTVNLLSTALSWLTQSITGLGDGMVSLRFLFGFIPRFGVNSYKGPAFEAKQWSQESDYALLCVAQPLLARLGLASFLILLLASGRVHNGLAGGELYSVANIILDISLFTGLLLALPFRKSPGYRLMILLTDLPPNTLGQSVRHLYSFVHALIRCMIDRDRSSRMALKGSVTSWRDLGLLSFAIIFVTLVILKALVILFIAIPRLASGLPDLFGGASQFIFTAALLILLLRFISSSIFPKFVKLQSRRSRASAAETDHSDLLTSPTHSPSSDPGSHPRNYRVALVALIAGIILFLPINRTVTGSVVVSTERDLTVRAPADVRITRIFQRGPSSQVISAGTPLIQLQSQQLDYDLNQATANLEQLKSELSTLTEQSKSNRNVIRELRASLAISRQAEQVLENQLVITKALIKEGAYSQKMAEDILLRSYDEQSNERVKIQQILELQAEIETDELKIKSVKKAIRQSQDLVKSLLLEKQKLKVHMPFDGLITSSTSGLMWSFVSKGESLLELKEGSLNVVNVLIPDHDRSLVGVSQKAEVRLYAEPSRQLSAVVKSIRPTSELIEDKSYFQASLRLIKPLSPQLLQSSGAARIQTGKTNLFLLIVSSIGRFIHVDLWSWTP
jgi:multidrug resistance efflux pump